MRNFWLDGSIDGRQSHITGGPRRSDGGFNLDIKVRDDGESVRGLRVLGVTAGDSLFLHVFDREGRRIHTDYFIR